MLKIKTDFQRQLTFRALASDEGLTLETSALKLSTVSSLRYQLSW